MSSQRSLTDSPERSQRIAGLDGLRAVSILLVLVGHGWATIPYNSEFAGLGPYLGNATLGVTTFFVISGYLITHLLQKEWERTGTIGLWGFYSRRIFRIFPALYAYLLVLLLLRADGWVATTLEDLAIAASFLTNYKHLLPVPTNDDYWFVGHFWTLSLEEQFYLFWPVTILALGLKRVPWVALVIVLGTPAVRVATYFLWPAARPQLSMMLHTAADPIMFGCLAALWQSRPSVISLSRRPSSGVWGVVAVIFLLLVSPCLASRFRGTYSMTAGRTLESLAIVYLLLWIIRNPGSRATRMLSNPVARHIGVLSYSLYLWQQLFLTPRTSGWSGGFPLNLLLAFAAAEASYWMVERPFLQLRNRFRGPQVSQPGDSVVTKSLRSGVAASV